MSDINLLVCGEVKAPQRKFGDAGIDVYVPDYTDRFIEDLKACNENYIKNGRVVINSVEINIAPNADIKFPLYIKSKFPENRALIAMNKSGVATKQKLLVGACVIDSSYEGIWHANLFNTSQDWQTITYGNKIVQFVPIKVDPEEVKVLFEKDVSSDEFYEGHNHDRGARGFGEGTGLK